MIKSHIWGQLTADVIKRPELLWARWRRRSSHNTGKSWKIWAGSLCNVSYCLWAILGYVHSHAKPVKEASDGLPVCEAPWSSWPPFVFLRLKSHAHVRNSPESCCCCCCDKKESHQPVFAWVQPSHSPQWPVNAESFSVCSKPWGEKQTCCLFLIRPYHVKCDEEKFWVRRGPKTPRRSCDFGPLHPRYDSSVFRLLPRARFTSEMFLSSFFDLRSSRLSTPRPPTTSSPLQPPEVRSRADPAGGGGHCEARLPRQKH